MDAGKLEPRQPTEKVYGLISIIAFVLVVVLGIVFLSVLIYQWFLRPATSYTSVTPVVSYLSAIV